MSDSPNGLRDDLKKDGYSKEEEYFYKVNRELIERRRKELDPKRHAHGAAHEGKPHWMTCPKCGQKMSLVNLLGIQVEQCPRCQGVYFDRAELETLLEAKEQSHFFRALWRRVRESFSKVDLKWNP